jgi:hypothetical protein
LLAVGRYKRRARGWVAGPDWVGRLTSCQER